MHTPEATMTDYQRAFESSPDLFLLLSPDLVIIDASDNYLKATLTSRRQIQGKGLFEIFPDNPNDPSADGVSNLSASLKHVLTHKTPHKMAIQKYDIRRQDGSFEEKYWSPLNTPVLNDSGEVSYIIHRVEDVTELERAKRVLQATQEKHSRHLRESEDRFFKMFNLSPVAIYMTDVADGRFQYVNRAFEKLFLMKSEDVVGKTVIDLKITDEKTRANAIQEIKEKGGRAVELEVDLRISSGDKKNMLLSTEVIDIDNRKCFLVALVDITERKKMERDLKVLNEELESFTYSVSHDLRAPLRAVTGFARILEEDYNSVLNDEGRRILGTISSNAEKMGLLIDDLLTFSRLGRKELIKKEADMNELVKQAIEQVNKLSGYHADVSAASLHHVKADPGLLLQVMVNLVGNALKYSSKKEHPVVEIRSEVLDSSVVFSVKDNGVGFDMRYSNKLFGVFQRLHSSDEFEGTGVGLAIVKRIISKHGGNVWAESKLNEGSVFYFSLPL